MNIELLKNSLTSYGQKYSLTFTKKIARRNEFVFSVGESGFLPKELIWENEEFALMGEGVEETIKKELTEILKKF